MKTEEYGIENQKTIVMLHGAHFVHTFGRQYPLSERYHIIVPHLMGFGDHTDKIFQTEDCLSELVDLIRGLNKKVLLVGFSLGAQLAFRLITENEELFDAAILVSPWLIKDKGFLSQMEAMNQKQLRQMKNKTFCNFVGLMNGLPRAARKDFVRQMQGVREETIHNIVYNGISLENLPHFADITVPVFALAGEKEPDGVKESVKRLAQKNPNCKYEIWEKAAHNIPPLFYRKFNAFISEVY